MSKRRNDTTLDRDSLDDVEEKLGKENGEEFAKAPPEVLAQRRIVRVQKKPHIEEEKKENTAFKFDLQLPQNTTFGTAKAEEKEEKVEKKEEKKEEEKEEEKEKEKKEEKKEEEEKEKDDKKENEKGEEEKKEKEKEKKEEEEEKPFQFTFSSFSPGDPSKFSFSSFDNSKSNNTSESPFTFTFQSSFKLPSWGSEKSTDATEEEEDPEKEINTNNDDNPSVPTLPVEPVQTGEEDEDTLFSETAKMFELVTGEEKTEWKERGKGTLKFNQFKGDSSIQRLIMRTELVFKLICNVSLSSIARVNQPNPTSVRITSVAIDEEKNITHTTYLFKVVPKEAAKKLFDLIEKNKKL